ncbi:uncharacterized protein LOC125194653 [Salvia hispanica]|uniref:uncharacterized protein LOC125194653 n=1 Tax=Salvia hispanica TaxID=49212 RepID=UPI002009753B|nr:uncharacterized protein LOC125194653 [Salvia hispanica]
MNPDDYDLSTSDGCRRALTRALFDAVNEAKAECLALQREQAAVARVPRPIRRRTYVPREHDVAHERLFADYFAENLRYREDGIGRPGLTPLQKCTVAIRQLAYETPTDMFDEYLHVGDTTGRECLKKFCKLVVEAFGNTYLRCPTADDCQSLMRDARDGARLPRDAREHRFRVEQRHQRPQLVHPIRRSVRGSRSGHPVHANGRTHHMGYYLAEGIYPRWPVFLKTISCPIGERRVLFAAKQESTRKDVERAFGVLQLRWAIMKGPARFWYKEVIVDVMYACTIMHNTIVEQERGHVTDWVDDEARSSSSTATSPVTRGLPVSFGAVLQRQASMRNQQDHTQLMTDMIEVVWNRNRRR